MSVMKWRIWNVTTKKGNINYKILSIKNSNIYKQELNGLITKKKLSPNKRRYQLKLKIYLINYYL